MTKRRRWTPTKLARPSRLFPVLVLVLCYAAPIQLGSQSKQVDPGQESPGGSTARTSFDSKGWLPSRLGEPMLRDPMWVYNNWPGGPPVPPGVPPITCMNIKTKGLQNGHLVSALILILETLAFLWSS